MPVCVGDDRELHGGARSFVDIGDPVGVGAEVVGALMDRELVKLGLGVWE